MVKIQRHGEDAVFANQHPNSFADEDEARAFLEEQLAPARATAQRIPFPVPSFDVGWEVVDVDAPSLAVAPAAPAPELAPDAELGGHIVPPIRRRAR